MSIDFEAIRKEHDLTAMIEQITGQHAVHGNKFPCLFHEDHTPSMVVYPDTGTYYCFGCGASGDIVNIVAKYLRCDTREAVDRLEDIKPTMRSYLPRTAPKLERVFTEAMVKGYEDRFGERELGVWRDMGIPAGSLYQLRVGFNGQYFVFPWFYRGDPIAFKLRRDDTMNPHLEPKYTSKPGSKYDVPYNLDVLATHPETLLIVEDEKSVIAALTNGLSAISMPASQFKAEWASLVGSVKRVIIVADNDAPGLESADKLKALIRRAEIFIPPMGKDLFDLHTYWREAIGDLGVVKNAMHDWLGVAACQE